MGRFLEARKSTSKSSSKSSHKFSHSSTHHTATYANSSHGGHLPTKTVLIIIGVVVGIIVAILLIYVFVHHREYRKGTEHNPVSLP